MCTNISSKDRQNMKQQSVSTNTIQTEDNVDEIDEVEAMAKEFGYDSLPNEESS